MVLLPTSEAIASLASGSINDKIRHLKEIKNILVGHPIRKEAAVKDGLVSHLAAILSSKPCPPIRQPDRAALPPPNLECSTEDELRQQAAIVTGSVASGGPAFLPPLCAADMPKILSDILVESLVHPIPVQLTTAVLQALHAIAAFWAVPEATPPHYPFWPTVFNQETLKVIDRILQDPERTTANHHFRLVTGLLAMLPEGHRAGVAQRGILDRLASLLVAHTIRSRIVQHFGGDLDITLKSAPPTSIVPNVLAATANLVAGSNYRAHCFMLSSPIRQLFNQTVAAPSSSFSPTQGFAGATEACHLPLIYVPATRSISHTPVSNHFPAMRSVQSSSSAAPAYAPAHASDVPLDLDHANAVCGWLLVYARQLTGPNTLMALKLVALIAQAIDADPSKAPHKTEYQQKTRERIKQLTLLAVPLVAELIPAPGVTETVEFTQTEGRELQEQACSVLALLLKHNKELQVAAMEYKVPAAVCALLKKSYDNVTLAKPSWSPKPRNGMEPDLAPSCTMGSAGLPPEILYVMRCREGALQAIASIVAVEDSHRKAIIDAGAVTYIIDSLKQFPPNLMTEAASARTPITPRDGNTSNVVLAACQAARAMSRSVTVLRTSLIDGGIAKPIIQLLRHPSYEIQVAATDVCCNLAPDFSPLREDLIDNEVVDTLVEHAKSDSPALSLSSLWALKHLILTAPPEFKFMALRKLDPRWLMNLIKGDQRDPIHATSGGGVSVGLSSANAAGERVELLNPPSMDLDLSGPSADDEDEDGEMLYDEASSTHYQASQMRSTLQGQPQSFNHKRYLSVVRETEHSAEYAARRDLATLQAKALDFIRNFLTGPEDGPQLCDHLFSQFGGNRFYELLTEKLLPIPATRSATTPTAPSRNVYHPTDIVQSTIHVINHIANSSPVHRAVIISQTSLLRAMVPHFSHHDHNVRAISVHCVINMSTLTDSNDRNNMRFRGQALRSVGLDQAVRALQTDPVLDVRERVKTAIRQLEQLG